MRITGGSLGGRRIAMPPGAGWRPTQDRVREAVFSVLAAAVPGCRFADLYAGCGAVGLEAWSRGAAQVVFVERDPRACAALDENLRRLCPAAGPAVRAVRAEAEQFLRAGRERFDVVYADPPYDRTGAVRTLESTLRTLEEAGTLTDGGLLVFEQSAAGEAAGRPGWIPCLDRRYGETRILMYRRAAGTPAGAEERS